MSESPSKRGAIWRNNSCHRQLDCAGFKFCLANLAADPALLIRAHLRRWRSSRAKKTQPRVPDGRGGTLDEGNGSPCVADGIVMLVGGEAV